jgi:hypothetical protein
MGLGICLQEKAALTQILSKIKTGANPTTLSYSASAVKFYSGTNSMARFYTFFFSDAKTL